jgi:sigma-B regulation protein RsbU (phosphoserine phosphatase)
MPEVTETFVREQLLDRRRRLESAVNWSRTEPRLVQLLHEVDSALARLDQGAWGICEVCHDPVEADRLMADPLVRYCLDHLSPAQRSALERDLETAAALQRGLLPETDAHHGGWQVAHTYRPLGPVSGDYCDLLVEEHAERGLFFFVGDVSGKGVAASMLTAQLHAIFRSLVTRQLPVPQLFGQASRIFCESALSPYYATMVGGRAGAGGSLEIVNAGHCPPLLVRGAEVTRLDPSGTPLGMFSDGDYRAEQFHLEPGDVLLLYTDGMSEARNPEDEEYGEERILASLRDQPSATPQGVVQACIQSLARFLGGAALTDDLTVMAIQRTAQA